ncbi:hypothetical protein EC973_007188 [Apophysomyces ossiformis]|uniref:Myb-like domain-containing protein n=1 Tax=Apophysomyces ossiformis TaxID=679940 RepID=A0A8H7BSB2_9FUNG|nr:hypothetical protein EC973_007188 [Apophysomyces ossiformis]
MDIKNLLCPISNTVEPIVMNICQKSPVVSHQSYQTWSSASSSVSSVSPTMSSYSSVPSLSPSMSPAASPIVRPAVHRHSTTRHARNSSQTRTPWTPAEDYLLQQGYSQGLSWAMISSTYLPHRSRGCCWGRFKTLQAKAMERREWTENEDRQLLIAIKKNARLFKQAWKSVARDVNDRSWRECELRSAKIAGMIRKRQLNTI